MGVEPMERKKMDDLISRKALLERLHDVGGCGAPPESWADGYDKAIDLAYGMAENAPAVDAAPVVHGRWDDSGRFKFFDCDIAVRCSMCGGCLTEKEYAESVWNFCPVCGAKMDGGNDND